MEVLDDIVFSADLYRYVLPFSFQEELYEDVIKKINERKVILDRDSYNMWTESNDLTGEIDLYHYVECSVGDEKECLGNAWAYNNKLLKRQQEKSNMFSFAVMDMDELIRQNPVLFDIDEIGLYLFKSGVGFIWYSINYKNKTVSDIIETNYVLKELARESLSKIYKNNSGLFQFQDLTKDCIHYMLDDVHMVMDNYLHEKTKVLMAFRNTRNNKIINNRIMPIDSEYECSMYQFILSLCHDLMDISQKKADSSGSAENSDFDLPDSYKKLQIKVKDFIDKDNEAIKCRNVKSEKYQKESKYLKNKLSDDELENLYNFYVGESLDHDIKYCSAAITSLTILKSLISGNFKDNALQYFMDADSKRRSEEAECYDKLDEFNILREQVEEFIQKYSELDNAISKANDITILQIDEFIERLNLYKIKCHLSNLGKLDQDNDLIVRGYANALKFTSTKLNSILSGKTCYSKIARFNNDFRKIPDIIVKLKIDDIGYMTDVLVDGLINKYKECINNILIGEFPENQELILFFTESNQAEQLTVRKISLQDKEDKYTIKAGRYTYQSLFADYLSDFLEGIPISSFFSDRKTSTVKLPFRPDKALLYSYVYIDCDNDNKLDEQTQAGLIYRMGRCYSKNYEPNNRFTDLKCNSYMPFSYQTWFASREGCTNCVIATPDCFSGKKNNYFGNEYVDRTKVEFYMYILVLQQFYGLLKANETISIISNNTKDNLKEKSNKLIESYVERMQIFRVKNVFSQVSPITHENGYFQYLQKIYQIDDYMQEINNGLGAVNELLEKKADKIMADKVRIFSLIGAAFVLIQTINNIIGIYNDPSFMQYYSSGHKIKLISLLFANEGSFLLFTLLLTILICVILYYLYYVKKKR